jgi:hypothetical protein
MFHLAGESEKIIFPVGNDQAICIDIKPVLFSSPITFLETKTDSFFERKDE